MESGDSGSLSPPKDTAASPSSPSGFLRNVKKRESKGKGKEARGEGRGGTLLGHAVWFGYVDCAKGQEGRGEGRKNAAGICCLVWLCRSSNAVE